MMMTMVMMMMMMMMMVMVMIGLRDSLMVLTGSLGPTHGFNGFSGSN